jgi:hypothetical protein
MLILLSSSLKFIFWKFPYQIKGLRGLGGVSDTNISQKQTNCGEPGRSGGGGCGDSGGNFGIGSRDIDSADGGWDDDGRLPQKRREAGGEARSQIRRRMMRMLRMCTPS